jgi:outer membrane receptor protein involved in Fe transport
MQMSGRRERNEVDTGTRFWQEFHNLDPVFINYGGVTLDGEPYFSRATYGSNNYTMGFKYQPVEQVILRVSRATAFMPPAPDELLSNPIPGTFPSTIDDPVTGQTGLEVFTLSGGNPDLKPQTSRSLNAGIVWQPQWAPLRNLRLNAEYYNIEQFNAITSLNAQQIVDQESEFPGRVTRDGDGNVTLVDTSYMNLFHRETEGLDFTADYTLTTGLGRLTLRAQQSNILHLKNQFSQDQPENDAVGYSPNESGAPKSKSSVNLVWDSGAWTAGWTARYISSYKQWGAAGGPISMRNAGGEPVPTYFVAQGGDTIPSQMYHDLLIGYSAGERSGAGFGAALLSGVSVQFGMRNVFNKAPPFDVLWSGLYYNSPYGDMRLRTYWLNLKKSFF